MSIAQKAARGAMWTILSGLGDDARILLSDTLEMLIHRLSLPLAKIA